MLYWLILPWSGCLFVFFCKFSDVSRRKLPQSFFVNFYAFVKFKLTSPQKPAWSNARYVGNFTGCTVRSLDNSTILHSWNFSICLARLEIERAWVDDDSNLFWSNRAWRILKAPYEGVFFRVFRRLPAPFSCVFEFGFSNDGLALQIEITFNNYS